MGFINEFSTADQAWQSHQDSKNSGEAGRMHRAPVSAERADEASDLVSDEPPDRVWMHNSLGYWFSVADECREEGDIEYIRADCAVEQAAQICDSFALEFGPQIEGSVAQECSTRIRAALASTQCTSDTGDNNSTNNGPASKKEGQ